MMNEKKMEGNYLQVQPLQANSCSIMETIASLVSSALRRYSAISRCVMAWREANISRFLVTRYCSTVKLVYSSSITVDITEELGGVSFFFLAPEHLMEAVFSQDGLVQWILVNFTCQQRLQLCRVSKQWLRAVNLNTTKLYFLNGIRDNLKARIQEYAFFRIPNKEEFPSLVERFPNLSKLALYDCSGVPLEKGTKFLFLLI